jgi:hypothetical protein
MESITKCPPVLFWHVETDEEANYIYHLKLNDEEAILSPEEASYVMIDLLSKHNLVIGIN